MMMHHILERLEGCEVHGIHCSQCDHLITVQGPEVVNEDFFMAAQMHDSRYHHDDPPELKTSYDIRATKRILVHKPVESINLTLKA